MGYVERVWPVAAFAEAFIFFGRRCQYWYIEGGGGNGLGDGLAR